MTGWGDVNHPWGDIWRMWGDDDPPAFVDADRYHVMLGGQGLMLPPGGWARKLGTQYALKMSVNGTTQNDRLGTQALEIDDWFGGEGQLSHELGTDKYRRGSGIDVFTEDGAVGLGVYMNLGASTAFDGLTKMATVKDELFVGRSNGTIYTWNGTTLTSDFVSGKAGGITSICRFTADLCYAGNGTDGVVYQHELSTGWAAQFTIASVNGVRAICPHWKGSTQWLYLGGDFNANRGSVYYSDGTTVSTAFLLDEPRIDLLIQHKGALVIIGTDHTSRRSSLYTVNSSGAANEGLTPEERIEGVVILCGTVLDDVLYLGDKYGGRIWKWDGSKILLFAQIGSDVAPYTGEIRGMLTFDNALWVSIVDTDGTLGILRFESSGARSRPVTGLLGTTPEALCEFRGRINMLTSATGAAKLYAANGTFRASGNVESGLINANLTGTGKLWTGVSVNHSALVTSQSIEVQYQLEDSGSWVGLGTNSTVGTTSVVFDFPSAIMAEQIAFKIVLTGPAGGTTPLKVFALVPRYLPSPGAGREWSLRVLLRGTTQKKMPRTDGTDEPLTGEELSAEMWAMVDAIRPVIYVDIDRTEYTVQILEYSEALAASKGQFSADALGWELDGTLRLREVGA